MDNLTHTLTGLMLSRAGLNRLHPRASLILLLAANAPDCDVISIAGGPATYFQFHRWITHAIIAIPFVAVLPVLVARLFSRKRPFFWRRAWILSLAGVISHVLLDFTNPYGIRLLLPFTDEWPVMSITSVFDVWIWTILIVATLAPALSSLVSSEIGAKAATGRGWAITALVLLTLYDGSRAILHSRAVQVQEGRMYNGETPRRCLAYPTSLNPLVWQGIVETGAFFRVQRVDLSKELDGSGSTFYKPESTPAIEAAANTELFQTLSKFSRALHWRTTPASVPPGAKLVEASDLFFGFTATAVVDHANNVLSTEFHFRP